MYRIKDIKQTCYACPSQWEAKTINDIPIYIRYRWGYLSIRKAEGKSDNILDAVDGDEIYGKQIGDKYDGIISLQQVLQIAKNVIKMEL